MWSSTDNSQKATEKKENLCNSSLLETRHLVFGVEVFFSTFAAVLALEPPEFVLFLTDFIWWCWGFLRCFGVFHIWRLPYLQWLIPFFSSTNRFVVEAPGEVLFVNLNELATPFIWFAPKHGRWRMISNIYRSASTQYFLLFVEISDGWGGLSHFSLKSTLFTFRYIPHRTSL